MGPKKALKHRHDTEREFGGTLGKSATLNTVASLMA